MSIRDPGTLITSPALVRSQPVASDAAVIQDLFDDMAVGLHDLSECELGARIRAYDNNQRFTMGRGQTELMNAHRLVNDFSFTMVRQLRCEGRPDSSYFPSPTLHDCYARLESVVKNALAMIVGDLDLDELPLVMATVFLHRVVVRPGERYPGFFHRDLPEQRDRIGTVVIYSRVRWDSIQGADLYAYGSPEALGVLRGRQPDALYSPRDYAGGAMVMKYPHNFAHGARPGCNPEPIDKLREASLRDFLVPRPTDFVKDLAIVTVSSISPVEQ